MNNLSPITFSINELFKLNRELKSEVDSIIVSGSSSNLISTNNSSSTNLGSSGTFVGTTENVLNYNVLLLNIKSDVNSQVNGVIVEFGNQSGTYDIKFCFTYKTSELFNIQIPICAKYLRVTYSNDSAPQTSFNLTSTLLLSPKNTGGTNGLLDAFGRLRISDVKTLMDISHTFDSGSTMIDEKLTNGGSSSYDSNASCIIISVSASGDQVIRQSRKYCIYQPGKSLLIKITGILNGDSNDSNTASRLGYYDDSNGFFFEYSNGTMKIVYRNKITGIVSNQTIEQPNWNINTLSNISNGYVLDPSKVQIYFMDLQWLGVGRVRMGVVHNGHYIYVHEFLHDNIDTDVYITTANLPLRHELISTGGTGQTKLICSSVISEGGYDPVGMTFSAGRGTSDISVRSVANNIETPLVALRLNSSRNRTMVIPTNISILNTQNANMIYYLRLYRSPATEPVYINPATGVTWNSITTSAVEYATNGDRVRNQASSLLISQGYFTAKTDVTLDVTNIFGSFLQLTSNIDGVSDILVLSAISLGADNQNTYGSIQWKEIF
jgi:hypothetical protein